MVVKTKKKQTWHVEAGRFPSSPARRAAAKELAVSLKIEWDRLQAEVKTLADTVTPLVKMAQFVVDVDGDATAIARLKEALENHKAKEAAGNKVVQVRKQLREAQSASDYFKYKVGTVDSTCGFGLFFVEGTGDTRAEAMANAKSKEEGLVS